MVGGGVELIQTEAELEATRARLEDGRARLDELDARLRDLSRGERKRALDPLRCLTMQLEDEIEVYERARRGSFEPATSLRALGRLLIAARVFRGVSQRELAARLGVDESQVSRDERNEYRAVTAEHAARILAVLDIEMRIDLVPREGT